MTKLLEQAVQAMQRLPPDAQDGLARALLGLVEAIDLDDVEPEHCAALAEGLGQAERGAFAAGSADEIVTAAFRRHKR